MDLWSDVHRRPVERRPGYYDDIPRGPSNPDQQAARHWRRMDGRVPQAEWTLGHHSGTPVRSAAHDGGFDSRANEHAHARHGEAAAEAEVGAPSVSLRPHPLVGDL